MSWDPTWEQVFRSRDWGRYPPEELVRFVGRNFFQSQDRKKVGILELGCGTGANLWFLAREGFDAYGVDGSPTAIEKAERRMPEEKLSAHLTVGDIIALNDFYPPLTFDAVIDVACLQHNRLDAVGAILKQILAVLKPGGKVFSMMLASGSYGDSLGTKVEPGTFVDVREGPLKGMGLSHFFTIEEVRQLFDSFSEVRIEYSARSFDNRQHEWRLWVIEGTKSTAL